MDLRIRALSKPELSNLDRRKRQPDIELLSSSTAVQAMRKTAETSAWEQYFGSKRPRTVEQSVNSKFESQFASTPNNKHLRHRLLVGNPELFPRLFTSSSSPNPHRACCCMEMNNQSGLAASGDKGAGMIT